MRDVVRELEIEEATRLAHIRQQNKELQDQIDAVIAYGEGRERNKRIPLTGDRREQLELEPRGLQGPEVGTTELPHKEGGSAEGIRERPPMLELAIRVGESWEEARQRQEELEKMNMSFSEWLTTTTQGLGVMQNAARTTFGSFADLAKTAFQAGGEEAEEWFALWKAISIAVAVINTYTAATQISTYLSA